MSARPEVPKIDRRIRPRRRNELDIERICCAGHIRLVAAHAAEEDGALTYIVMACIVMAYISMAYIVMYSYGLGGRSTWPSPSIVMAQIRLHSYGLHRYGLGGQAGLAQHRTKLPIEESTALEHMPTLLIGHIT